MIARSGALGDLIESGARILDRLWSLHWDGAGPVIGRGLAAFVQPQLRGAFRHAQRTVFLASPETCAASALTGVITDPQDAGRKSADRVAREIPCRRQHDRAPAEHPESVEVVRGPNIKPPADQQADAARTWRGRCC